MKIAFDHELLHLYGPFSIHMYGVCIAIAIAISVLCAKRNKRFAQLNLNNKYVDIIIVAIAAGVIGGRALEIVSSSHLYKHWSDVFSVWNGGFSILGSIIGVTITVPLYLRYNNIPILPVYDLAAIYTPLLQSIARLGCLFAGCCYGITTTNSFSVMYTNSQSMAPLFISLHPTQLYSSILLFFIFLFMYCIAQHHFTKNGQLFSLYLILVSLERFTTDFWRAERMMYSVGLSFHQLVALAIILSVFIFQLYLHCIQKNNQ